jgi:hypothetical protein
VVTREDIVPGYQVVQSTHSIADFIFEHPQLAQQWKTQSNSIITLSVKTLSDLEKLSKKLRSKGFAITDFYEPDIDDELTSFCVYGTPEVRKMLSYLPLTLKKLSYGKRKEEEVSV